jgi:hypothetical protein
VTDAKRPFFRPEPGEIPVLRLFPVPPISYQYHYRPVEIGIPDPSGCPLCRYGVPRKRLLK